MITSTLEARLLKRKKQGNLRQLQILPSLSDFSSNDYLGLARSSELAQSVLDVWERHLILGSTGSRLLTGNSAYVQDLEDRIAQFHGYEAGTLFSCGYMANVGLISAIAQENSAIFFDAHVHASTHDGIRLSRAQAFPFRHNNLEHLENRLKNCTSPADRFICIESVYSTDGSRAPLVEICDLAKKYDAHIVVDEAHAVGLLGPMGRGLAAGFGCPVFAQVCTFGKALGTHGAIVLGNTLLKQTLINFARSYIYTTALPMPMLIAIQCSYDLFPQMEKERMHLCKLIEIFQNTCPLSSSTQIQSIPIKGSTAAKEAASRIVHLGFDVRPLLSPTVRQGEEVLRICLHSFNTQKELKLLLEALSSYWSFSHA